MHWLQELQPARLDIVDAGDLGKFTTEEYYDGGTQVLLGEPLRFDKDNIAQWKDKF